MAIQSIWAKGRSTLEMIPTLTVTESYKSGKIKVKHKLTKTSPRPASFSRIEGQRSLLQLRQPTFQAAKRAAATEELA